ncbi:hypothetical protein Tco_1114392 [Tanacetum coccineum]|uniref:Integrase, catalytic region, zinc finger, CCHC-type, peptidase aspartic, catalytic n=1 Tax=Tanacetum coccineum TaxID=301880 RepID=A0ABQ5IV67_9ASTR
MTTLAYLMIIAGADNHPPMLEKSLYDSWKSRIEHYMENWENGRMILNSVQNGPLIWPIFTEEDGTTRTKKYDELSATENIQADCDCKATNIVLQGLPPVVYAIINHHKVAKEIRYRGETLYQYYWRFAQLINNMNVINMSIRPVQVNTNFPNSLPPEWSKFVTDVKLARDLHRTNYDQLYSYLKQHENHANETRLMCERYQGLAIPVFNQGDDPIACLNKAMAFLTAVAFSRFPSTNNQPRTSSNPRNQATIQDRRVIDGRLGWLSVINVKLKVTWLGNALSQKGIGMLHDLGIPNGQTAQTTIPNTATFQTGDLDGYDSDCDDVLNAKAVLMANLSSYGSDVLSESHPTPRVQACYEHPTRDLSRPPPPTLITTLPPSVPREAPPQLALILTLLLYEGLLGYSLGQPTYFSITNGSDANLSHLAKAESRGITR